MTLALPQDVQADAFDYPAEFFETPVVEFRAVPPSEIELAAATRAVIAAKRPVIIAGGGVLYGGACEALREFSERHGVPVRRHRQARARYRGTTRSSWAPWA